MGELDEMAGKPAETDALDSHLKVLFGSGSPEAKKSAFKAAVHLCMDEYDTGGDEQEEV